MKGGFVRILILGAAMWIVACGGRQSSVPTTVTSGGAKVPAQPHHGTSEASNPETTADEPIDLDVASSVWIRIKGQPFQVWGHVQLF